MPVFMNMCLCVVMYDCVLVHIVCPFYSMTNIPVSMRTRILPREDFHHHSRRYPGDPLPMAILYPVIADNSSPAL